MDTGLWLLFANGWLDSLLKMIIWFGDHGILAVLFTTLLFWWLNIRYGKLIVDFPKNCDISVTDDQGITWGFDMNFLFYNSGTPDIMIRDGRVIIEQDKKSSPFWCSRIYSDEDKTAKSEIMAIISGRKGYSLNFSFSSNELSPFFLKEGICNVLLELKLQHRHRWIRKTSRAKVSMHYPRRSTDVKPHDVLRLEFLDQPTVIDEIREA